MYMDFLIKTFRTAFMPVSNIASLGKWVDSSSDEDTIYIYIAVKKPLCNSKCSILIGK